MGQDVPDVDDLPAILDQRDKPIFVAAAVEYREGTHGIGMRKDGPHISKVFPIRSFGDAMPVE
jgi:hypothetical protein